MDRGRKTRTGQKVKELFDMFEEVTKKESAESALLQHTGRQRLKWTVTLQTARVELNFLCLKAWHQFKLNIHNHCRDF